MGKGNELRLVLSVEGYIYLVRFPSGRGPQTVTTRDGPRKKAVYINVPSKEWKKFRGHRGKTLRKKLVGHTLT